jgi:hypothetical protein
LADPPGETAGQRQGQPAEDGEALGGFECAGGNDGRQG